MINDICTTNIFLTTFNIFLTSFEITIFFLFCSDKNNREKYKEKEWV